MVKNIIPIIICGGEGKRLWPVSNKKNPKQFIPFLNKKSLFDLTIEKAKSLSSGKIVIIASIQNKEKIKILLKKHNVNSVVIFEEIGRNTTAAIIFGLSHVNQYMPNSSVIIMPSDHYIPDNKKFKKVIHNTIKNENNFNWLLLGIKPSYPATGYGYIEASGKKDILKIKNFIEKPNFSKAKKLLLKKNIFWNSGIFLGNSHKLLESIRKNANNIYTKSVKAWENRKVHKESQIYIKKNYLEKIKSESIDKAVLEKELSKAVTSINTSWSDIGSWDSYSKLDFLEKITKKNVIEYESKNNLIYNDNKQIITIGIENLILITQNDKILLIKKGCSEKLKKVIDDHHELNN